MNFIEFWAPVFRQKKLFFIFFISVFSLFLLFFFFLPQVHKVTIYFTLKPVALQRVVENNSTYLLANGIEEGSKVAETVSGWAQDPFFRNQLLEKAGVFIPYFKQKISAKKQNRLNVFWTLKLIGNEIQYSEKLTEALIQTFHENFETFNKDNVFPFGMTDVRTFSEPQKLPFFWFFFANFFISFALSFLMLYFCEVFRQKVSFLFQVQKLFPDSPILRLATLPEKHDTVLLKQFIATFDSPRLVSTFSLSLESFPLAPLDAVDEELDTPLLLVRLGVSTIRDLENLKALFGEDIGIIVFEK